MQPATIITFLSIALTLSSVISVQAVEAAVRKDVSEYAGKRCNTPPVGSGIIVGQFSGVTDSPFISGGDGIFPIDRVRCFQTLDECNGWLYTMQSKFTDAGLPTVVQCLRR